MCMCVYHIFFVHLSIVGHLGCFHVLVVVSNTAVNMAVTVSLFRPQKRVE